MDALPLSGHGWHPRASLWTKQGGGASSGSSATRAPRWTEPALCSDTEICAQRYTSVAPGLSRVIRTCSWGLPVSREAGAEQHRKKKAAWRACGFPSPWSEVHPYSLVGAVLLDSSHTGTAVSDVPCHP